MFIFTAADIVAAFVFVLMLAVWLIMFSRQSIKQMRCKHDGGVTETGSCMAICNKCGKNLGFIGTEENKKRAGRA
jgi:hypothetical protein